VPHLLQYFSNSNNYGRIKVGGKIIRESLKTDGWTTAKLRRTDFLKEHQVDDASMPAVPGILPGFTPETRPQVRLYSEKNLKT
jgi:hypothetical protein